MSKVKEICSPRLVPNREYLLIACFFFSEQSTVDDKWPMGINRSEDKNVSQEEQERKSKQAAESEKRAREAEDEHWRKERSVMPPPRSNKLTGMLDLNYHAQL